MTMSMLTIVKVKSGTGRAQRIPVNGAEMTFATLVATLERDVDFVEKSSQLTYKDDEGDWCLLVDDSSLRDAVALGVGVNGCLSLRVRSVGTDEFGGRRYSPGFGTMRGGGMRGSPTRRDVVDAGIVDAGMGDAGMGDAGMGGGGVRGSFGCPTRDLDDAGMVDAGMGGFSPEMAMRRHHRMNMCRRMMGPGDTMRMNEMMKRMWMNEMMNLNGDEMQRKMIRWCRFMNMGWGMTQPQTSASEEEPSSSGRWANCPRKWGRGGRGGRWGCHRRGSGSDEMGEISGTADSDWQGSNMWRGAVTRDFPRFYGRETFPHKRREESVVKPEPELAYLAPQIPGINQTTVLNGIINRPWLPCLMAYSKNGVLTDETLASVLVWGLSALILRLSSLPSFAESVEELNVRLRDIFPQTVKMVHSVVKLLVCRMSTEASTIGASIRDGRSNSVGLGVSFDNCLSADSLSGFIKELELVDKCEEQTKMMVALAVVPTLKIELNQFFVNMKTVAIDDRVVTHHGLACAQCKVQGFIGPKFVCTKCGGGSYVLCGNCYATRFDGSHDVNHTFGLALRSPGVVVNQGSAKSKAKAKNCPKAKAKAPTSIIDGN